jgi:hypothetical protein
MMTPEVIGTGVDLEYEQIGFSEGKLDFSNSETDNALLILTYLLKFPKNLQVF